MTKSPLETDIFNYHTPEFFINMKSIPDKTSKERKSFVLEEKRKGREGININGIFIPGGLYFHLNYYHLQRDATQQELLQGSDKKIISLPNLRDNEWIVFNDYDKVCKDPQIYTLCGARQLIKTEFECSSTLRELSLFKNTEALGIFQADEDKDTFVKKIRIAIEHGEKFIIIPNIDKDWGKKEIRFGITKQDNSLDLRGTLYLYNTQEGKKVQVGAGKTPTFFFGDEIAKSDFRTVYDVIEPALLTDTGRLRCPPLFTFTGGETEKAKDAKNLVLYPDEKKQFTSIVEDRIVGARVLFGQYRKDCKKATKFSDFIGQKTGTWLDDYIIMVSDFELADKTIDEELAEAAKSPDPKTLLLKRIFFPRKIDDIFLMEANNSFPIEACMAQQEWLKLNYEPSYVELYRTIENKVKWRESNLVPIAKFPVNQTDNKIAPICVYEFPQSDVPHGTYTIGVDAYNQNESSDRINSLGAIYVFKRTYDPLGKFQDEVVASYAGRPYKIEDFYKIAYDLCEFYNAQILNEANKNFEDYFINKKKGHFVTDSFTIAQEISNKSRVSSGQKGLNPTPKNQGFGMDLAVRYTISEDVVYDKEREVEKTVLGVSKIKDPMLLEEMIQYRSQPSSSKGIHGINCDRIVAFYHALILANHLNTESPLGLWTANRNTEPVKNNYLSTGYGIIHPKKVNPFGGISKMPTRGTKFPGM